jgi:hypothetical protein
MILGSYAFLHFNDDLGAVMTTPGVILRSKAIAVNVANQNSSYDMIMAVQPPSRLSPRPNSNR